MFSKESLKIFFSMYLSMIIEYLNYFQTPKFRKTPYRLDLSLLHRLGCHDSNMIQLFIAMTICCRFLKIRYLFLLVLSIVPGRDTTTSPNRQSL